MKKDKEISAWARALYLALEEDGDYDKVMKNLFSALENKKYLLPSIIKQYISIKEKEDRIIVYLANEIGEDTKKKMEEKIEGLLGKNKKVDYIFEKDLIGGFRIKTKDYLVKASIKDALTELKNKAYGYN